jgi:hypothetical protein
MLIGGVLALCAAVACAGFGTRSLVRGRVGDDHRLALRAMAPAQIAAAVMLAAGGVVTLAATPEIALVILVLCLVGALGTLAAGAYQSARFAARLEQASGCGGQCPGCTRPCEPG